MELKDDGRNMQQPQPEQQPQQYMMLKKNTIIKIIYIYEYEEREKTKQLIEFTQKCEYVNTHTQQTTFQIR